MEHHERRHQDQELLELKIKVRDMEEQLKDMNHKLDQLTDSIAGLVISWNTGKAASTFLIGMAKLATAGAVIWAVLKNIKWSQFIS